MRVTRRALPSQATSRPWRSRVSPLAPLVGSCTTLTPASGAHFIRRLLPISLNTRYPPSCHHSGPSAGPMSLPKPLANSSTSCRDDTIRSKAGCCCSMGILSSFLDSLTDTLTQPSHLLYGEGWWERLLCVINREMVKGCIINRTCRKTLSRLIEPALDSFSSLHSYPFASSI